MSGNYNQEGYQPFAQNADAPPAPATPPVNPPFAPYPPPPYSAYNGGYVPYQYYAGPMAAPTNGMAIASLILSITGFIATGIVGSILGVIFGHIAQGQIKRANPPEQGAGLATAGLILGYIGIGLNVLIAGTWLAFIIISIIVSSAAAAAPQ